MQNKLTFKHVQIWRDFNGDAKNFHEKDGHITMCFITNSNIRRVYSFIADEMVSDVNKYNNIYNVTTTNYKEKKEFKMEISQTYFPGLIKELRHYYKRGRILVGDRLLEPVAHSWGGYLYYQEVKKLLAFENRSSRYPDKTPRAVRNIDPKRIAEYLDLGDYALEQWGSKKRSYSFITFKKETHDWICSMVGERFIKFI